MEFHHHAVEGVRFAEINWPIIAGGCVGFEPTAITSRYYVVGGSRFRRGSEPNRGNTNAEAVASKLGFGGRDVEEEIMGEDEEEDFLSEIMRNAALEEPDPADVQSDGQPAVPSSEWFPYPTKMVQCLLREFRTLVPLLNCWSVMVA
ncbi:hypothetical protein B0H10DRAFT_2194544 [Mycena sp. CBHHK59/15]|nr:hypothetical protein B0H10DRAFT_2194544 [Mycena sp. CBHHK59/15]